MKPIPLQPRWTLPSGVCKILKKSAEKRLGTIPSNTRAFIHLGEVERAFRETLKDSALLLDGKRLAVVVIDSGLFRAHEKSRPNQVLADFNAMGNGQTDTEDLVGHGSHVSGIIAGQAFSGGGSRAR
ncbi:MAG: hypothetical protein EXS36_02205 [Pedosphaera sp.]|nr:hypothetical protein [Pedosphaera sp.]